MTGRGHGGLRRHVQLAGSWTGRWRSACWRTGGHIAIYGHFIPAGTQLLTPELAGQVTYDSNFYGVERGLEPMGNVHYAPSNLSQTPAWLLARRPRVAGADLLAPG